MRRITWVLFCFLICMISIGCSQNTSTPEEEKLDKLNLQFVGAVPIKEKIPMKLIETRDTTERVFDARIERRGGFSISFPKHSYEVDLEEDLSIADLPADDDWILNANYIDKTFLRHVMSYELFTAMDSSNITSACQYVEVDLNGKYNGLYVLMEKLDKSSLEINGSDTTAFTFKDPHVFRDSYKGIAPQDSSNFHQQTYPKIKKANKRSSIESLRNFILDSDDKEFETSFSSVFDIHNIMDWHLLILISNNSDGILKNFYLYKQNKDTPAKVAPWDYDHSFGRDGDNELNMDTRPLDIKRSILFKKLLQYEWYKLMLKKRWEELNHLNILSVDGLSSRILQKSKRIRKPALKNFEVWPLDSKEYYDANNFDEEIDVMLKFIPLRHERISKYFDDL